MYDVWVVQTAHNLYLPLDARQVIRVTQLAQIDRLYRKLQKNIEYVLQKSLANALVTHSRPKRPTY